MTLPLSQSMGIGKKQIEALQEDGWELISSVDDPSIDPGSCRLGSLEKGPRRSGGYNPEPTVCTTSRFLLVRLMRIISSDQPGHTSSASVCTQIRRPPRRMPTFDAVLGMSHGPTLFRRSLWYS